MCTLTFMYLVELTTHVTHLSRQICFYIIVQTSINDMNGKYFDDTNISYQCVLYIWVLTWKNYITLSNIVSKRIYKHVF